MGWDTNQKIGFRRIENRVLLRQYSRNHHFNAELFPQQNVYILVSPSNLKVSLRRIPLSIQLCNRFIPPLLPVSFSVSPTKWCILIRNNLILSADLNYCSSLHFIPGWLFVCLLPGKVQSNLWFLMRNFWGSLFPYSVKLQGFSWFDLTIPTPPQKKQNTAKTKLCLTLQY